MSNTNAKLTEAYEIVMADIAQDVGYDEEIKTTVVGALKGRLYELTSVWPFFEIVSQLEEEEGEQ